MTSRIRYKETHEAGIIESSKVFPHPTDGATYKVLINQPEQEYKIVEVTAGNIVAQGRAVNLHQVKLKAKAALAKLGIAFEEKEVRTKATA